MNTRYETRKTWALNFLGNKCVQCDRTDNLQFDHINPKDKTAAITKMWCYSVPKLEKELIKCQLLCDEHHLIKTFKDKGIKSSKNTHGTLSSYRHCKCPLCKSAKTKYNEEYNRKNKIALTG